MLVGRQAVIGEGPTHQLLRHAMKPEGIALLKSTWFFSADRGESGVIVIGCDNKDVDDVAASVHDSLEDLYLSVSIEAEEIVVIAWRFYDPVRKLEV